MTALRDTAISSYLSKIDRLMDSDIPTIDELVMVSVYDPSKRRWKVAKTVRPKFLARLRLCLVLLFDKNVSLVRI